MDFSRTFYKTNNYKNIIQLELSKNNPNKFNYNKELKKNSFYYGNLDYNKLIKTSPKNKNAITNKMIKTINEFKSSKSIKDSILNNFHNEIIKLKIRKNRKYKSLFDKIDISSPSNYLFKSPQTEKKLINIKLKSNKNKLFNQIFFKNINSVNCNNSENIEKKENIKYEKTSSFVFNKDNKKINNNFFNYRQLADDINRTHFTTLYYSSLQNNKSTEKSISSLSKNINNKNTDINISNKLNEKINDKKDNNKKNNINKNFIYNNILKNETEIKNNLIDNSKYMLNILSKNSQSFITSINNIQTPPCVVEFSEQNLQNFYARTRDLRYIKYFLYLKKNKLKNAKEKKESTSALQTLDLLKLIHFYKLFKPYNHYLEKYLIFLKEKITIEYKSNQKLKIRKNNLLTEIMEERRKLLGIHKTLKDYLNDKFFLLCVKNFTLNLNLFDEKDKIEFEQDLKNFEILKNYLTELSAINFNKNILSINKKVHKKVLPNNNNMNGNSKKINGKHINHTNNEKYLINIFNNSEIHFKPRPIFGSINEFNDYMKQSRKKVEYLLMEDNKIGMEVSNLRDYYLLHLKDINIAKDNQLLLEKQICKLNEELFNIKNYNTKLMTYKNTLLQKRKNKNYMKINKKLLEIINLIYQYKNKKIRNIINNNNYNIDKPILILNDLENVIIYFINFKNNQKENNNHLYNEVLKKIDKNKKLDIIKQKREEDKNRIENKCKEIIEKDLKLLNFNNSTINE